MPWTRRQVRYLLSKGSPLSGTQRETMLAELHVNPAMGHMRKKASTPTRGKLLGLNAMRAS